MGFQFINILIAILDIVIPSVFSCYCCQTLWTFSQCIGQINVTLCFCQIFLSQAFLDFVSSLLRVSLIVFSVINNIGIQPQKCATGGYKSSDNDGKKNITQCFDVCYLLSRLRNTPPNMLSQCTLGAIFLALHYLVSNQF